MFPSGPRFGLLTPVQPAEDQSSVRRVPGVLLALLLVGVAWWATQAPNPPAAVPAGAPADRFSAERAFVHVQAIAQQPHPVGSPANAEVRDYLLTQLRALGLEPELQPFTGDSRRGSMQGVNVMARLPGQDRVPGQALALVCHYDSVPAGPGASDDGAGVATLLETARALRTGVPLRNTVILLFTDGEEAGLHGARAFGLGSAWMKEIGCVLNFEARGVSGPVFMFETHPHNLALIREFARAAPRPVANSLMGDVYRRMPNNTDFTVFKTAGVPGLNFAFIGDAQHYHAPTDDLEHFELRSLQHNGSYALSLARHLGDLDLSTLGGSGADAVYFDLFGRCLVYYPAAWAVPLALLAAALFVGVTWSSARQGDVSAGKLVLAWLAWGVGVLVVGLVFRYGLELGDGLLRNQPAWRDRFLGWPYWRAAVGLTVAATTASYVVLRPGLGSTNLAVGALCWWVILAIGCAFRLPGASYLSLWPLVVSLVGIVWTTRFVRRPWLQCVGLGMAALPVMILVVPLVYGLYIALGPRAMLAPMIVLALALGALAPQLEAVSRIGKWTLPTAGLLFALAALVT